MQRYELDAWLGDDHGLTEDQITCLLATADEIAARYPDPDDGDDREQAFVIAYRVLVEPAEDVVAELAVALSRARRFEHAAKVALRQAAASLIEPDARKGDGVRSEAGFAEAAGVDRQAVRSWLGKR
ncbi:MAG TPA: hypothetical protein VHX38_02235 [Pseudonocardiaceae bacterium]|jgi:hypothetical protein|nr:hypothetical protein [Pseudonocardiaceae bacterium]